MYNAIIAKIEKVYPHNNADKIQLATILGSQLVVGLDAKEGDIVVYFESDGQLSEEYAKANDLIAYANEAGEKKGGYFDKNRRIRCQKFRGEKSEAYCCSIESLAFTGYDISKLKVGDRFDTLNNVKICNKYITENTKKAQSVKTDKKDSQFHKYFKQHVRNLFPEHIETNQWRHYSDSVEKGSLVTITHKMHGTCLLKNSKVLLWDGVKKNIQEIKIGDEVVGFTDNKIQKAVVCNVFEHTPVKDWLNVKVDRGFSMVTGGSSFSSIKCTPEHLLLTTEGYKAARDLNKNDRVFLIRKDIFPSEDQIQIIMGKLLGDASLTTSSSHSCGLAFRHKKEHECYIDYTLDCLGNLAGSRNKISYISGYGKDIVGVTTKYSSFTKKYFCEFKTNGEDRLPEWISERISPIALAFWYMDDGSLAHSELQEDRACFATCRYSYKDCLLLKKGLENNGIHNITIYKADEYWRIRINAGDGNADKFFRLVSPFIPQAMRYKLPQKYKNVGMCTNWESGQWKFDFAESKVISVDAFDRNGSGKKRYDISTTTQNFVVNDVIVHNSGRLSYIPVPIKLNFFQKMLNKLFFGNREHHNYKHIQGTRRVVKYNYGDGEGDGGYYGADAFRDKISDKIKTAMNKNEIIYFEIVGYTDTGSPIMGSVDTTKLKDKEFTKRFGQTMTYKYGCLQGECEAYVYRIAVVNPDGVIEEMSWDKVKKRCGEMGIKHVPEIDTFIFNGDKENLKVYINKLTDAEDIADSIDASHIREGICIRIDKPNGKMEILKNKTFYFRLAEGIIKDSGVADVEEAEDIKTEEAIDEG